MGFGLSAHLLSGFLASIYINDNCKEKREMKGARDKGYWLHSPRFAMRGVSTDKGTMGSVALERGASEVLETTTAGPLKARGFISSISP